MISIRRDNFRLAYRSLTAVKGRSFLTMLGIIIGVMAVILVVCIGQGVKDQISGQLVRYGKNVLIVQPGSASVNPSVITGFGNAQTSQLSENDLRTVQKVPGVGAAIPLSTATGTMRADHEVNAPFIVATTADFPEVIPQSFASGGFFEDTAGNKTVALGENIAHKLFDDNAPLGQSLIWRGEKFTVTGVFHDFKAPPLSPQANFNNAVFMSYTNAQKLTGNVMGLYEILIKPKDGHAREEVQKTVQSALVASHGGTQDVRVESAADATAAPNQTIRLLTMFVAGAAIIALIVGGIGIMNVMLVSVTERMHEIGLRKAIGATNSQIMRQFVAEAFVLSTVGAVIGVALSCVVVGLLRLYSSMQPVFVWPILVIAPLIAIATGVLFGSLPALKAARKDPIEALRHE